MREKIMHPHPPIWKLYLLLKGGRINYAVNKCILFLQIHANATRVISICFECCWTKNSKTKIPASEKQYTFPNDSV